MDLDWTFSSCSWLWEDDLALINPCSGSKWTRDENKAFEDALTLHSNDPNMWHNIALAVPGKTLEDLKLHYEALVEDVAAIEAGKIPSPDEVAVKKRKKKSSAIGVRLGVPWTDKEHRRFIGGLHKYGRGDWKSIASNCVKTKSNSQVASHAQKYFNKLKNSSKKRKRSTTNDMEYSVPEIPVTFSTTPHTTESSTSDWRAPPSPIPFGGSPFSGQMITGDDSAPPGMPDCIMFDYPFAGEGMPEVGPSGGMQESFDPETMDMEVFTLPHFLDID